jgi:alpha-1,6-mannosyltransferase
MHICDLTTLYIEGGEGGVNTYLTEKARYLAAHDGVGQHTIIVPGATDAKRTLFRSTLYTIKSPRFFYNPHHRVMTDHRGIKRLLEAVKPDVVEVDCVYFLGRWALAALGRRRVPLVGFYHTHLPSFYARPLMQRFGNTVSQMVETWAWHYIAYCMQPLDKVFVASNDLYERLLPRIDKKIEQVPLGVNLELFRPQRPCRSRLHRARPVILYVGRLSQEKDLTVLFEAFQRLNRCGRYHLRIIGDGPLRPQTEHFVRTTPHVSYDGMVPYGPQLAELYANADVLALPSRNETFGLTILEALASGIPVVAVNQGGPSTLLPTHVGALAIPGEAADFAEKLLQVLAERPTAQHCRSYVTQHFSWDKTFVKLLDIYDNLYRTA